ncbi:hypothetical protein BN2476_2170004 [Paraburkholderia piptadeniae]|uniref:Uncharacterized protein n=2 Tax=Paraburkholderia TaxID=1822464 RepID=A0A7X1TLN2_9BURK|nr:MULTISPECIES: hypothetical protein [Paraburkholderia]MPW23820.1 hypothetical protein [Paraburkholderia franconis]SIT52223.1 hypothetical protein BN2476_2170004 [Paraburkholderia piptadeniae]
MARTLVVEEDAQALERNQVRARLVAPGSLNRSAESIHLRDELSHPYDVNYQPPNCLVVLVTGPVPTPQLTQLYQRW